MTTGGESEAVEAGAFGGFGVGIVGTGLITGACAGILGFGVGAVGTARGELNIGSCTRGF